MSQFIPKIRFDTKLAVSLGMSKEDIKAMKKAVKALNKALKADPATVTVVRADLGEVYESLTGTFNDKGKLKIKSLSVRIGEKTKKLKYKKDYLIEGADATTGTVTIKGTGNFDGIITVNLQTGKQMSRNLC